MTGALIDGLAAIGVFSFLAFAFLPGVGTDHRGQLGRCLHVSALLRLPGGRTWHDKRMGAIYEIFMKYVRTSAWNEEGWIGVCWPGLLWLWIFLVWYYVKLMGVPLLPPIFWGWWEQIDLWMSSEQVGAIPKSENSSCQKFSVCKLLHATSIQLLHIFFSPNP